MLRLVILKPRGKIDLAALLVSHLDRVTPEIVREDSQVSIFGELVGQELAVCVDSEDVGEEDDGFSGGRGFGGLGGGDVGIYFFLVG